MKVDGRELRVLHVGKFYPPHMGGIETHLQTLCLQLQHHADVEVLVANDAPHDEETWDDGVRVVRAGTRFNLSTAPVCPTMTGLIKRSTADIVHLHLPNPTAILCYLLSGQRAPLVITYHSDIVRQKTMARAFAPVLRRVLRRASAIIATSQRYIETSDVLTEFRDRCRVIPYGIPLAQFNRYDARAVEEIRARYGSRLVISVGRLIYYKGFEYLIKAMADVRGRLLIVGDGALRASLEALAAAHGVADRVVFLGEIQNADTVPFYHAADLFALASVARSEAFGIVQLEAMACGKPVVNTNLDSGVPFVSLDGLTGVTVAPFDTGALARAINQLLDDDAQRAEFGRAARLRVEQEFSEAVMTERTLKLYAETLGLPATTEAAAAAATARSPDFVNRDEENAIAAR